MVSYLFAKIIIFFEDLKKKVILGEEGWYGNSFLAEGMIKDLLFIFLTPNIYFNL